MDISVEELKQRIDNGETLYLIDVREEYEYEEQNLDGILIPLGELLDRMIEIAHLKDQEVLVHCRSGKRSATAQKLMEANGFQNVRNVTGGILAWNQL